LNGVLVRHFELKLLHQQQWCEKSFMSNSG